MKLAVLIPVTAVLALAQGSPGIRPRGDVSDYPAHQFGAGFSVGAALVPQADVRRQFATNLDGYAVIEVGVFPESGKAIDVSPADFRLLVEASGIYERSVDAEAVAANVTKSSPPLYPSNNRSVSGSVTGGVAIGAGTDPVTGRRGTGGGVAGSAGNGGTLPVACRAIICDDPAGPAPPADSPSPERRRAQTEQELWAKSLPDGGVSKPIAGYLFFPKPKTKNAAWTLQWDQANGRIRVELGTAKH